MKLPLALLLAATLLAACREEVTEAPAPLPLTEEAVSFFCQMNVLEHGGPKAQIHLEGLPAPLFFAQVRDGVAYLKSPERDARILATYVSDMGAAPSWNAPGERNWIPAEEAHFVIGSRAAGGMGAPEIVPFAAPDAAEAFILRFGGRTVRLPDIPDDAALGPVDPGAFLETPS
ncbi:nitrous oxide reductase accessory protein NosL [Ovoidimarina sediminis]|uniref:nitrous oxide reductase accessory protein NosL n=1 Tax=Ovoidimarina sediminis TaxID=3079856 RepID=UPI00290FBE47|nr:nitrous oxide reductase accessory protein NosL [Rhodophyticola sp. MJ-SS7]MDU8941831.1 nitrous oxide reductase accessory protein NosL [Rhodophyticola sp. MJ-SS7]